ncbi:ATP-dependent helicase [Niallia circulans]|uniref:DEAD-box ATP-dependent RNA helicase CshA n=1 Tax=Niallia circulans TaxID=1397 RepID=A0A0J1I9J6_NIACI|nr:DEAD/DEAH box helicase [Niallia circulans]KLV22651.1 DEAD/DEAH box helicase [Niallia circulans]MDR4318275.1 DEAD/DEAH box helicase [Niallia circulans]MED3840490.1 DEAD/DEAH box helicase [Niallia circulans]MED4243175.1 DEAD/DEAH box helicase [Niallia circulans]MED4250102.1 DEAD/DEAH box helicase [Niallia circulans]
MVKFQDLGISPATMKALKRMGFEEATPIQAETIPLSLQNKDLIGQAQTGTGKTAAFGVPLVDKIDVANEVIQGIIIAPTRELAIQVSEELYKIGYGKRTRVLSIFGGQDINRQIRALKKNPHIIVGTPGRILDHINRKTLRLDNVQTVILDEADEMLNMGFIDDIEAILSKIPTERQTLLFSATMPGPIRKMAERFMKDPEVVKVKAKEMTVPLIEQYYIETQEKTKFDILTRLLDIQSPELAIIFGRTKRRVDELSEALNLRGYTAEGIHGDLSQAKRMSVLRKFKEGTIDVLVATDVAARGLDISGVTHVYNFDIPQDPESYVHRIGRTGRAGKEGVAITFITYRERSYLQVVEKTTKRKMEKMIPPTVDQAIEGQQKAVMEKISQIIEENNLDSYRNAADDLLEQKDASTVVAAVLKMLTKEPDTTPVKLTEEKPLPMKRDRRPYDKNNDRGGRKNYNPRQRQGYGSNKRQGQSGNSYNKSKSYR